MSYKTILSLYLSLGLFFFSINATSSERVLVPAGNFLWAAQKMIKPVIKMKDQ